MFSRLAIPLVALLAMSALANWIPGTLAQDTKPAAVSPQVPAPKTPREGDHRSQVIACGCWSRLGQ
jgi:hypothetical protein